MWVGKAYQNLSLHCYNKKDNKVDDQNGPEHGNIEQRRERAEERNKNSTCYRMPAS